MTNFELLERVNLACRSLDEKRRLLIHTEDPRPNPTPKDEPKSHPGISVRMKTTNGFKSMSVRLGTESPTVQLIVDDGIVAAIAIDADLDGSLKDAINNQIDSWMPKPAR